MTFEDILELLNDTTKTKYQLAADLHALISKANSPSPLNIQPRKERKKREVKPRGPATDLNVTLANGHDDTHAT